MNAMLVEDDADLGDTLKQILEEDGFRVDWAKTGSEALYFAADFDYDILILDRMLPELDGIGVLRTLRQRSEVPVLMLTALNEVGDRIEGLDAGADDYLGKPFEMIELLARVRALIRRAPSPLQEKILFADLVLEPMQRKLTRKGKPVELTRIEYTAVEYLLRHRNTVVTRETLERLLYEDRDISGNPVDVLIHRIRRKLGKTFVRTRRGHGFIVEHADRGKGKGSAEEKGQPVICSIGLLAPKSFSMNTQMLQFTG
jgi:DNA-binding response OmpR family regulator